MYGDIRRMLEMDRLENLGSLEFIAIGGPYWWWIRESVDDFTGWECLKLLQMTGADREASLEARYAEIRKKASDGTVN